MHTMDNAWRHLDDVNKRIGEDIHKVRVAPIIHKKRELKSTEECKL
jgi:hypothetical protein